MPLSVCITGATGYLGRELTAALIARGHRVRALARPGSAARVAAGSEVRELDVFDAGALAAALERCDAAVHLIGTPHPNPSKGAEFQRVDLGSARAGARRLGLVTLSQMTRALVAAVEDPPPPGRTRIVDVPAIRDAGRRAA